MDRNERTCLILVTMMMCKKTGNIRKCDTNKRTRKVHSNERTLLRAIIQTLWYLLGNTLWHQLLRQQSSLRQVREKIH